MKKWFLKKMLAPVLALAALAACAPAKPTSAELDAYLKARDLYLRGSVDEAASLVSHIASRTRVFHQARLLEGKIEFFKGNMDDAERVFRELTGRVPGYTEAALWLIRSLQAGRKTQEAERLLEEELGLNPGDPRFLHQAAMLRLGSDDISGALSFFRRAQEYAAELSQSYIESARILYRFGFIEQALGDLAIARALLPADSGMRTPVAELEQRIREGEK